MTEQQMPARIVAPGPDRLIFTAWGSFGDTGPDGIVYIRGDIAERMAFALVAALRVAGEAREEWDKAPSGMKAGKLLIALSDPDLKYRADITEIHSALSAFRSATQDTEARHD